MNRGKTTDAKEASIVYLSLTRLLGKVEVLHIYSEMNELFKIIVIQLTRMFFLSKPPIIHFHSSFQPPPPPHISS